ncbi:hypothetical protein Leryth_011118 [Lithospermum erythrorhizon]|nr:hypothetical protein Leryth_011118 [Lithospermum erythrorhizon]
MSMVELQWQHMLSRPPMIPSFPPTKSFCKRISSQTIPSNKKFNPSNFTLQIHQQATIIKGFLNIFNINKLTITMNSFSINPTLSSPLLSAPSTSSSYFSRNLFQLSLIKDSNFCAFGTKPINLFAKKIQSLQKRDKNSKRLNFYTTFVVSNSNMTITDYREEDEEENPSQVFEDEMNSKPRRIVLFVEPSPFSYVSGYKNRFQNFIRYLREMGDEVLVVTTHEGVPEEFYGAKLIGSQRQLSLIGRLKLESIEYNLTCDAPQNFPFPWYQNVPLSLALSPRIISAVADFKPDIIHASSPGFWCPFYRKTAECSPCDVIPHSCPCISLLRQSHSVNVLGNVEAPIATLFCFHRLSNGEPKRPLIVHVGRIGVEKSLDFLKSVMDRIPEACIAFIGDGPYRPELEKLFEGMPAVFTGMLQGEELSQAYASGDVFIMPSESETLGLVVLEAMSSGLPVVGARAGGIPDIIPEDQEGKTGYLFNPGDLDDCLNKLVPLLHDSALRDTIGQAAREEMEKFDWRAATKRIRNEQYNAAIWFWRKKRAQFLRPFQWLFRLMFQASPPAISYRQF